MNAIALVEKGLVPDVLTRAGIRRLCAKRLVDEERAGAARQKAFLESLSSGPVAPLPEKANEQHYELPPEFMALALGPRMKYSSCYYPTGRETLAEAEEAMLALTCERAELADGQRILELGCGWGSLTLWMAQKYPGASITAVSNSAPQREHILARARERGLTNVEVLTRDMNSFDTPARFDRVVSVEMFEHMRNYPELMRRVASWLAPGGKLFVHVFCHKAWAYPFVDEADDDWMARHFFSGGQMPSEALLLSFQERLVHEKMWVVDGRHYERTANDWLARLDARRAEALETLKPVYGSDAALWLRRWRVFYMACAELFGYEGGSQWRVAHYLFRRRD
ncbi:MAG: cyclopropane-fatty-acyl-phospholipid synthase family protein [Elusimicrobiota bacterium]|nr:MAG: cyclopropane-fatty-acyl-phospholipid synthase family protein [Elusimicrobiota bacterium]